jgi:hypothetical protein
MRRTAAVPTVRASLTPPPAARPGKTSAGDRLFAFRSSARSRGFLYLTPREQRALLQCRPRVRHPGRAARPINLGEAEGLPPGLNPAPADAGDLMVEVEAPTRETFAIDDPDLLSMLGDRVAGVSRLTLVGSDRALTDRRPVSHLSVQSVRRRPARAEYKIRTRPTGPARRPPGPERVPMAATRAPGAPPRRGRSLSTCSDRHPRAGGTSVRPYNFVRSQHRRARGGTAGPAPDSGGGSRPGVGAISGAGGPSDMV